MVTPPGPALSRTQPIANGSCQASCVYTVPSVSYNWWDPVSITETVTAETIITVINRKKNTTSFSTVTNPSWDPSKHPKPTDLNSDGTRTAIITDVAPSGSSSTLYTITFPTIYISYPPTYTVRGRISTAIDGKSTCTTITEDEGASFTWPSHPTIAPTAPILDATRFEQDPRGWSWVFKDRDAFASDVYSNASLPEADRHPGEWWLRPFFPNLPLWEDCSAGVDNDNPFAVAAKTALFLTGSSTAFEDGDDGHDDHDEKTSSPRSPASANTARPTPTGSVPVAPTLIASSKNQTPGAQSASSATPANTVSDQLPLQTSQASQTARASPADGAKGTAATLQDGGSSVGKQNGPSANAMAKSLLVSSTDATVAVASPSPNIIEPISATPLVMLPGSKSVVLSLAGSETTLAIQRSGPSRNFQFASQMIAIDSQGQFRLDGQTISPNQAVTEVTNAISGGMPQNTNFGGTGVNGPASTTVPAALIVGGQLVQPNAKGDYILQSQTLTTDTAGRLIIDGTTLAPGSAVTVSGTPISLSPPQRTAGIDGTSEQAGLGSAIMGGFGPGAPSSLPNANVSANVSGTSFPPVAFTGGASRVGKGMLCELAALGLAMLGLVLVV